ncbi:glycosyltransferase [Pantanalinema rosaneae CENA516]|uniref:glycosyltransferase n=1 Tax=Pantanalinema rosaneae TaxID=1620701 RepID=UPI003D6DE69B
MSQTPERLHPPFLSLCMIVKNESQHLARCLASAQPYVDEVVVVDTGSQDDTVAIAERFGATIQHFNWCDDFAAARNFSLEQVTGTWVLILDADEELVVDDRQFRQVLVTVPTDLLGFALIRTEVTLLEGDLTGGVHVRLFRNDRRLRYQGRYHEQLRHQDGMPLTVAEFPALKIRHYGNSDEQAVLQKTIERDIPLLEKMRQEEGLSLWLLDCLARNYFRVGDLDKAQDCYREAGDRLFPHLLSGEPPGEFFWVPTLLYTLAEQALEQEDVETARVLVQRGLEWCPNYPPLNYVAGEMLLLLGFPLGATAYFDTCLQLAETENYYRQDPCPRPLMTTEPACSLGQAYLQLGQPSAAIAAFELALSFDPNCAIAQEHLQAIRAT